MGSVNEVNKQIVVHSLPNLSMAKVENITILACFVRFGFYFNIIIKKC